MPDSLVSVSCRLVDTCYPDYVPDHRWVGSSLYGQTAKQMAKEVADEFYEHCYEGPIGDGPYVMIRAAALAAIKPEARFWPVNENGTEITDPDAEIPEEQPSAWFVFSVEIEKLRIFLDNQGGDDYATVLVTCPDQAGADCDGCIDGSSWECPGDMDEAYTMLTDRPSLYDDLVAAGYDVDASCYSAPDDEDVKRWAEIAERENA